MILQLRHRCPHCHNLADFLVSQISEVLRKKVDPSHYKWDRMPTIVRRRDQIEKSDGRDACGLSRCPLCAGPLLIIFEAPYKHLQDAISGQQNSKDRRLIAGETFTVIGVYPEATPPKSHPNWPEKIQSAFVDLQVMSDEGRHPSFILSGCRTVLDVATKALGSPDGSLYERIENLAAQNIITGGLRDWAQAIRVDGNAAVHSLEGSREDATEFVEFIKLFLHVSFELPAEIAARKAGSAATSAGALTVETPDAV